MLSQVELERIFRKCEYVILDMLMLRSRQLGICTLTISDLKKYNRTPLKSIGFRIGIMTAIFKYVSKQVSFQ